MLHIDYIPPRNTSKMCVALLKACLLPEIYNCPLFFFIDTALFFFSNYLFIRFRMDETAKQTLKNIPILKKNAGPRDGDVWLERLQEEFQTLIKLIESNKEKDADWYDFFSKLAYLFDRFRIEANEEGTRWFGKCWTFHNMMK